MRILVISNFYPPYYAGGYELGCYEVMQALKERGHEVRVLASTYGLNHAQADRGIYRWLESDSGWKYKGFIDYKVKLLKKELNNQKAFKRIIGLFKPDLVYIWNLSGVSVSLAFMAQHMGLPVCYYVFDKWLSQWESDTWYSLWNRRFICQGRCREILFWLIGGVSGLCIPTGSLKLGQVQFASHYLKQACLTKGKSMLNAEVIHWGLDVNKYPYKKAICNPPRLLYVGQIVEHKGVHTAVEALKKIIQLPGYESITLTIAGGTRDAKYEINIKRMVSSLGLENNVRFMGFIPRENLSSVYQEHDILLFPSTWEEGFGIILLEGMSSGLAVVSTSTGGSAEILQDEINALVFPKEDADMCANQILRLMREPGLFEKIRYNGRRTVEGKFNFEPMINKIESLLCQLK